MTTRVRVIERAASYLGTPEVPMGSNCQIFGKRYQWDCVAWCAIFCSEVLKEIGITMFRHASVGFAVDWAKKNGLWGPTPKGIGDLICFDWDGNGNWCDHIGILERNLTPPYQCIEGNTDNRVARRMRTASVAGFIRIPYRDVPVKPKPPTTPNTIIWHKREDDDVETSYVQVTTDANGNADRDIGPGTPIGEPALHVINPPTGAWLTARVYLGQHSKGLRLYIRNAPKNAKVGCWVSVA